MKNLSKTRGGTAVIWNLRILHVPSNVENRVCLEDKGTKIKRYNKIDIKTARAKWPLVLRFLLKLESKCQTMFKLFYINNTGFLCSIEETFLFRYSLCFFQKVEIFFHCRHNCRIISQSYLIFIGKKWKVKRIPKAFPNSITVLKDI